jgi:hypothetical protein
MSRTISHKRISKLLEPHAYWVAFERATTPVGHLGITTPGRHARRSLISGCFEQVEVNCSSGEICVWIYVKVLPGGTGYRLMSEGKHVEECFAKLKSAADVRNWEERFVDVVPHQSEQLARRKGPKLLERTARGRAAAQFYLSLLQSRIDDLVQYWRHLKEVATPEQREQARRSLSPAIPSLPYRNSDEEERAFATYQIAAYVMAMNSKQAQERGFFGPETTVENEIDMAFCYQVMASCIFGEKGSDLIKFD